MSMAIMEQVYESNALPQWWRDLPLHAQHQLQHRYIDWKARGWVPKKETPVQEQTELAKPTWMTKVHQLFFAPRQPPLQIEEIETDHQIYEYADEDEGLSDEELLQDILRQWALMNGDFLLPSDFLLEDLRKLTEYFKEVDRGIQEVQMEEMSWRVYDQNMEDQEYYSPDDFLGFPSDEHVDAHENNLEEASQQRTSSKTSKAMIEDDDLPF